MYTYKLSRVIAFNDNAQITIEYYKDDELVESIVDNISDPSSHVKIAFDHINELKRKDKLADYINNPPLDDEPQSFEPKELTPEELKKQQYNQDVAELARAKQLVDTKQITSAEYDAKCAAVLATKPEEKAKAEISIK